MQRFIVLAIALLVSVATSLIMADSPVSPLDGKAASIDYLASETEGEECNGPGLACASGAGPECAYGNICEITAASPPTCATTTALVFTPYCIHKGYECSGSCENDGQNCTNALSGHCSSTYWWFW